MVSFISVIFIFILFLNNANYVTASKSSFRSQYVASTKSSSTVNYELVFSGKAAGYSSYVLKSYHDDQFSKDAAQADCFTTCTGLPTCKMVFFYHCTVCTSFFCYEDSSIYSSSKIQDVSTHNSVLYDVYAYNKI